MRYLHRLNKTKSTEKSHACRRFDAASATGQMPLYSFNNNKIMVIPSKLSCHSPFIIKLQLIKINIRRRTDRWPTKRFNEFQNMNNQFICLPFNWRRKKMFYSDARDSYRSKSFSSFFRMLNFVIVMRRVLHINIYIYSLYIACFVLYSMVDETIKLYFVCMPFFYSGYLVQLEVVRTESRRALLIRILTNSCSTLRNSELNFQYYHQNLFVPF